ncbi:PREDICTED: ubiquitin-like domain-containing CTD phosphatase-like [Fragaria vesca subsp. vesca]
MAVGSSSLKMGEEQEEGSIKWSGKEYTVRLSGDDTLGELKRRICQLTTILPKRQKLLYPKLLPSKLADDAVLLSSLPFKSSLKLTMIGTIEDDIIVDPVDSPDIVDDFELGQDEAVDIKDNHLNNQKLRRQRMGEDLIMKRQMSADSNNVTDNHHRTDRAQTRKRLFEDVKGPDDIWWRFTGFYRHPDNGQRHITWDILRSLAGGSSDR